MRRDKIDITVEQMKSLLEKACFELGHFELRLFAFALSNGGSVVISKKTMCKITDTGINNVNKQLFKLNLKGMADLDILEGSVYTLTVNTSVEGVNTYDN
jgi:hypothetical protein